MLANKEYILITKSGVFIHADWRGLNAEVQVHAVQVMQSYLDDVLKQLQAEDPIVTETRKRVSKVRKAKTTVKAKATSIKKAVKKATIKQ